MPRCWNCRKNSKCRENEMKIKKRSCHTFRGRLSIREMIMINIQRFNQRNSCAQRTGSEMEWEASACRNRSSANLQNLKKFQYKTAELESDQKKTENVNNEQKNSTTTRAN